MKATAFVSGPYYNKDPEIIATNIQAAQECAIWLWEHNYYTFCPHLNTKHFEVLSTQSEEVYLDFCLKVIRSGLIDLIVLTTHNYTTSTGTLKEIDLAMRLDIPIMLWTKKNGLPERLY